MIEIEENETLVQFVERKIHDIFLEVAESESNVHPMAIFQAENFLLESWRDYIKKKTL